MAASKAAWLALDGVLKPLSLRTNCSEAARISSCVAGGSKLNSVLMLRHMGKPPSGRQDSEPARAFPETAASARDAGTSCRLVVVALAGHVPSMLLATLALLAAP